MSLYKRPESPHYWYKFELRGRTYRKSTGTSVRREAERIEREARVDAERSEVPDSTQALTPTTATIGEWDIARAIRAGRHTGTIYSLRMWWAVMARVFPDPAAVTGDSLDAYVDMRLRDGIRRQTIGRELRTLKRGLTMAWEREYPIEIPRRWPRLSADAPDERAASKWHPVEVVRKFFDLMDPASEAYVMMLLALLTGCRAGEMESAGRIQGTGIFPTEPGDPVSHFLVVKGKRRGLRALPVHPKLLPGLQARLPFSGEEHFIHWRTISRYAYRGREESKVITRRDLRAAFATLSGPFGDLHGTNLLMGHTGGMAGRYQKAYLDRLAPIVAYVHDAVFAPPTVHTRPQNAKSSKPKSPKKRAKADA